MHTPSLLLLLCSLWLPVLLQAQASEPNIVDDPKFQAELQKSIKGTVPLITCAEVWDLKKYENHNIVFLDARTREEYEVSHIRKAIHVGYETFTTERIWAIDRDANIIIYCAIGERSEEIGEKLQKMGFTNVHNLYGSIIEWANQGHVVYDKNEEPTDRVHVYEKHRAKYLKVGKSVY